MNGIGRLTNDYENMVTNFYSLIYVYMCDGMGMNF